MGTISGLGSSLKEKMDWKIPWKEEPGGYNPKSLKESDTTEQLNTCNPSNTLLCDSINQIVSSWVVWPLDGKRKKCLLGWWGSQIRERGTMNEEKCRGDQATGDRLPSNLAWNQVFTFLIQHIPHKSFNLLWISIFQDLQLRAVSQATQFIKQIQISSMQISLTMTSYIMSDETSFHLRNIGHFEQILWEEITENQRSYPLFLFP